MSPEDFQQAVLVVITVGVIFWLVLLLCKPEPPAPVPLIPRQFDMVWNVTTPRGNPVSLSARFSILTEDSPQEIDQLKNKVYTYGRTWLQNHFNKNPSWHKRLDYEPIRHGLFEIPIGKNRMLDCTDLSIQGLPEPAPPEPPKSYYEKQIDDLFEREKATLTLLIHERESKKQLSQIWKDEDIKELLERMYLAVKGTILEGKPASSWRK